MSIDAATLAGLIGCELRYRGRRCRVLEVLPEGPLLVLVPLDAARVILTDQYGEASHRGPELLEVSLLNPRRDAPNPLLEGLDAALGAR